MRTAAFAVLATYVGLAILAQVSVLRDGDLGLTLARRDGALRVAWVMPAGHAWYDGVRPGMEVVSLDDRPAASIGDPLPPRVARAEVRDAGGRILLARVVLGGMVHAPLKWSLWTVGLAFALCGSTIASRRPDLAAARAFVAFCACAAFALAVSPSAGGPHPPWALVVNFTSLIGIAAAILSFVRALDGRNAFRLHLAAAVVLLVGYAAAVIVRPELYSGLRIAGLLYVVLSIAAAIATLARRALRHRLTARGRQAGIVLFGIVVGALPFAALSVAPLALGLEQVAPAYLTVLATAFIPASAAIAVVQSQFLGIRRLVHRGMVYALTTSVLIVATVLAAAIVAPVLQSRSTPQGANLLIGALVAAGVILFYPLRLGASRLVDRFLYDDVGDPQRLIAALGACLLREDRNFHTIQAVEAAFRHHEFARSTPAATVVLVAAARYLAAHAPTARAQGQTYQIAQRLHRGERLHEEG